MNRRGFYTVEAAIFLPLLILAVLTIGYVIKSDSVWENVMHGALDECSFSAATCSSGPFGSVARKRIRQRVTEETPQLSNFEVSGSLNKCIIKGSLSTALPFGFGRDYHFQGRIRYRDFIGLRYDNNGMGTDALETPEDTQAVWVFPQSGRKYHSKNCTYVRATVHRCILTVSLKRRHSSCGLCHSEKLPVGSIVFCFYGEDTSYHLGQCPSIKRHTVVMDKSEAVEKGYTPCSKCQ